MATDGISGAAKAAIDTASSATGVSSTVVVVGAIVVLYLGYAYWRKEWPFKG